MTPNSRFDPTRGITRGAALRAAPRPMQTRSLKAETGKDSTCIINRDQAQKSGWGPANDSDDRAASPVPTKLKPISLSEQLNKPKQTRDHQPKPIATPEKDDRPPTRKQGRYIGPSWCSDGSDEDDDNDDDDDDGYDCVGHQPQPYQQRQYQYRTATPRRSQFHIPPSPEDNNTAELESIMQREHAERRERELRERQQWERLQEAERRHLEQEEQKRQEAQRFANMKVTMVMKRPSAAPPPPLSARIIDDSSDGSDRSQPSVSERSASDKSVNAKVVPLPNNNSSKDASSDDTTIQKVNQVDPADECDTTNYLTAEEREKRKRDLAAQQQLLILQQVQAARAAKPPPKQSQKNSQSSKLTMPVENEQDKAKRVEDQQKREPRTKGVLYRRQPNGFLLRITRDGKPEKRRFGEHDHDDDDGEDVDIESLSVGSETDDDDDDDDEEEPDPTASKPFVPAPIPKVSAWELGLPSSVVAAKSTLSVGGNAITENETRTNAAETKIEKANVQGEEKLKGREDRQKSKGGQRKNGKENGKAKTFHSKAEGSSHKTKGKFKGTESKPRGSRHKIDRRCTGNDPTAKVKTEEEGEEKGADISDNAGERSDSSKLEKPQKSSQKIEGRSSGGRDRGCGGRGFQSGRGRGRGGRGNSSGKSSSRAGEKSKFCSAKDLDVNQSSVEHDADKKPRSSNRPSDNEKPKTRGKNASVHSHGNRRPRKQQIAAAQDD